MSAERLSTALADRYRLEREVGAGGMATVYLAHDLRHERRVALKVLRPELAAIIGAERFLQEIKTTANLQHPHILGLIDSGEADGLLWYVMPFVQGESLRDRLEREKQLPVDEAIRLSVEVAGALDYAHRHGVIHRDIKPENILLHDQRALVADFGIALAVSSAGASRLTETGMSLGTPQYMSPEQAMGDRSLDARSDVYSLAAMLYEMLAGDPPYSGSTAQAIVAKVLTEKAPLVTTARDTVPPQVAAAIQQALAKLPADRFASAAEFATALTSERSKSSADVAVAPERSGALTRARRTSVGLGVVAALAAAAAVWGWRRAAPPSDAVVNRLEFTTTSDLRFAFPTLGTVTALALSPEGDQAVFAVSHPGGWALAARSLDQLSARVLPGTEGATYPEFSPDGRWIAFESADGMLKKIAVDGSALATLCAIGPAGSAGLTWLSDREIVFSPRSISSTPVMYRVSAEGGAPAPFSRPDSSSGERFQLAPRAVEGGKYVFYTSTRASSLDLTIGVVDARDGKATVFPGLRGARAIGMVHGHLVYVRGDGALMAVPFDARARTVGTPIQVGDSIAVRNWDAPAALSASGALLYQLSGSAGQLVSVDAAGTATILVDSVRPYQHPRYSPDGRRLAFEVVGPGGGDIWTYDLNSKTLERLTSGGGYDRPEWTPDGTRVLYVSVRDRPTLQWQPADGSAPATRVFAAPDPIREGLFTPDGRHLVYRTDNPVTNRDIWMVALTGDSTPVPLLTGVHDDKEPRISPDSRWMAYVSNESGREEVYVRALGTGGGRVPVSTGGGGEPLWAPDGRGLYYRAADQVIEATLNTTAPLSVIGRRVLFTGPYASDVYHPNYDVAPDGRHFVMVRPAQESRRLVMVLHWASELERRLGIVK